MYTIGTAAKATGKAKSTISRDIGSGRISAVKNDDGSFSIDPAELHRVYPPVPDNGLQNTEENDPQPLDSAIGTGGLQAEVERLRERLANAAEALERTEAERERERRQFQDQIEDLRRRADNDSEERRKLTAILTDQRQAVLIKEAPPQPQISPPVGFFRRLIGK